MYANIKHNNTEFNPYALRQLFPYFSEVAKSSICFDGVGGTQVPTSVIKAISDHLIFNNGNKGGIFPRSVETDKVMDETRKIIAEFLNAPEANEIILGDNFTNLTFRMSRALKETWKPGDEIIVSRLDHDANVSPWERTAKDVGVTVKYLDIENDTCQLARESLEKLMTDKTKLFAFCGASSSVGTRPDVKALTETAKKYGALVYVDAVALAPHVPIDVQEWGADFVGFSAYKMFGPHMGALWGRKELLECLPAYKIRPAPNTLPMKWLNGAQPYELAAGFKAALEYIAHVGDENLSYKDKFPHFTGRQQSIHAGMAAIEDYESKLTWYFIDEVKKRPGFKIWGITDEASKEQRLPPIAVSLAGASSNSMGYFLAERGIDVWSRSAYSVSLSERLGLEISNDPGAGPDRVGSFIRVSFNHYNTVEEIDTLLNALDTFRANLNTAPTLCP
jgi:cysteine desulfurase family protein (TIGR01976 family)